MSDKKRRRPSRYDPDLPLSEQEARVQAEYLEDTPTRRRFRLSGCVLIAGVIFAIIGLVAVGYVLLTGLSNGLAAAEGITWQSLLDDPVIGPALTIFLVVILLFSTLMSFYYWLRHQLRSILGCLSLLFMAAMVGALVWTALQGDLIDLDAVRALIE